MYNLVNITHHRARVQSFDALHDLSLALLATVFLPVDSGISQLLHHLQQKPPRSLDVLYTADISTCHTQMELTTYIITKIQYHLCKSVRLCVCTWLSSMLISSILLLAISTSSVSSSSMRFCSSSDCLKDIGENLFEWQSSNEEPLKTTISSIQICMNNTWKRSHTCWWKCNPLTSRYVSGFLQSPESSA